MPFNNITGALFHNNDDKIVITTFSKDEQNAPNEVLSNLNVFTLNTVRIQWGVLLIRYFYVIKMHNKNAMK